MPHAINDDNNHFKLIQVKELHPTFGAEVHRVDFSELVPEDVFSEIHRAITKVNIIYFFFLVCPSHDQTISPLLRSMLYHFTAPQSYLLLTTFPFPLII